MPACRMFAAVAAVWMVLAAVTSADDPRISISFAGTQRLRDDLQYLVELAPPPFNKQWKNIEEMMLSFEQGLEPKAPVRLDLVFTADGLKYGSAFPIEKMEGRGGFIENLESFSFDVSKPVDGVYTITEARGRGSRKKGAAAPPAKPFYMRHLKNGGYAVIASSKSEVPANLPDPAKALQAALPGAFDIVAQLQNDADGLTSRRDSFAKMRKELEAAVKFNRSASEAEIELRQLSIRQNLNEAERFLVESERLLMTWLTDPGKKVAEGELSLSALPDTSLHASIQLLCQKPSAFANVKFHPKPALQARITFPVDELRSNHAKELYPKLLPVAEAEIDKRPALDAKGKAAGKKAFGTLIEMLTDAIPMKLLDGFIDVHATADGKHGVICGIRAADGTKATTAFEQFPDIREGWKFEKNVAEHGGVTIHALTVAPHRMEEFRAICGGEPKVLVGVSQDIVWGAAGEGALEKLKTAIDQAAQPLPEKADPVFASLQMQVGPWIEVLNIIRSRQPKPKTEEEKEADRQRTKLRKAVQQAFAPGDDVLTATLRREEDTVKGTLQGSVGIQRFIGTVTGFIYDEYFE